MGLSEIQYKKNISFYIDSGPGQRVQRTKVYNF